MVGNNKDVISIVNNVSEDDIEDLINKVLSLKILNRAMPSVIKVYGEKYGVSVPETMSSELNAEVASLFGDAVKLVKTLGLTDLESIKNGNLVDNLVNVVFEKGVLKSDTKESLAILLNELNQSYLFKNVVVDQVGRLLDGKDYKVDARILRYVDSKEAWLTELDVLDEIYKLYEGYENSKVVEYSNVSELLNKISSTKVIISVLPFAYDELLPRVGIEIDSEGLPVIEFDGDKEEDSKKEFYDLWKNEVVVLKNIADALNVLNLKSIEDIDIELLDNDDNVEALSTIMSEVYKSNLLRVPFVEYMKDIINGFVVDYNVSFSSEELLYIDSKEKWINEFSNINNVLSIDLREADSINASNLNTIFTSINNMNLFKIKKVEILKVAIEESNFLTDSELESIVWPDQNSSQKEIDDFFKNETDVLVNIVDKKDVVKDLANITVETMEADEIGELLNEVMKSNANLIIFIGNIILDENSQAHKARTKLIEKYGEVIALHKQLNTPDLQETETSDTI